MEDEWKLLVPLACYGCERKDYCDCDFEFGHAQCDISYENAREFAEEHLDL